MTVTTFKVQGMTCGHCVSTVKAAVGSVPGVQAVEVDLATGTVTATGALSEHAVVQAISQAGYAVVVPDSEPVGGQSLPLVGGAGGCCCG
ncbi:heavy-metal-associated domain-containing protein [Mycolicibacterium chlorophenolicum]|uniref:Copper chaperone CopZ n=1 Tax=Mycolicibacterium chlorophenolicum TaxID=37916 RepID=A0A0J6VPA5_9MYCO|nr:heavy-metal-associated domain-containing protein [Mycolicibacterium chlorophenolicum]KMO71313.1 Copper chaperone CopZ [Mycolicibacterium chlorophenolicum]